MDHSDDDPPKSSARPAKKARLRGVRQQQQVLVPAPTNTPEAVQVYANFVTQLLDDRFSYVKTLVEDGRVDHLYSRDVGE